MNKREDNTIINIKELKEKMKEAVVPIDFEALIKSGVLEKRRGWYKVINLKELPPHASAKISKAKSNNEGLFVQFRTPSKRLSKMLEKF